MKHAELAIQIHCPATAQHRNLRVGACKDGAHLLQQPHPRVVLALAQSFDHGGCACPTGTAWSSICGQRERIGIEDISRGLAVHASAEHHDGSRNRLLGPRCKLICIAGRCLVADWLESRNGSAEFVKFAAVFFCCTFITGCLSAHESSICNKKLPSSIPQLPVYISRTRFTSITELLLSISPDLWVDEVTQNQANGTQGHVLDLHACIAF
mmetsp:Transcript_118465/g.295596  ORF Transcript_118465/g.295596 Transcript_118465/m.295596 type:complete len:211 (-) Transcript_118465:215-847(-)